jgi:hypothetical protein
LFSNGLRILAGACPGIVLESPDQKTRFYDLNRFSTVVF